jgi:hypothetical protein
MTDRDLLWWLGGAALLALGGGAAAVALSGPKITSSSTGTDGQIVETPDELIEQASSSLGRPVTMDAYALARMAASEGAREGRPRMHVALNDADAIGRSVLDTVTLSTAAGRTGSFGPQFVGSPRVVRRYATSKDPTRALVELAEAVILEHARGDDPTYGATKFADKSSFGVQAGTGSFADLVDRWRAEGYTPDTVWGYSTDFVIFRKA